MRRLLITGAVMVLMIVPQPTVWAEGEFTPAQWSRYEKCSKSGTPKDRKWIKASLQPLRRREDRP